MKIVFVCGSLEPGRDGVGDYTRRLAGALIKQGHRTAIVAFHDIFISTVFTGIQEAEGIAIPVFRIPAGLSKSNIELARNWVSDFDPGYCSLQYVPFAFHPKGLALRLSPLLLQLSGKRPWQVMIHELWVGMDKSASKKQFIWGVLQRRLIISLFRNLRPSVIHTQSLLYKAQLAKLGFKSTYLPLFSNIPFTHPGTGEKRVNRAEKKPSFSLVIFGTILAGAPAEDFANEAAGYAKKKDVTISLTIVGRVGEGQDRWLRAWRAAGLDILLLGEQSEAQVSAVLANATYGITTTAAALADKSGAVAAMREHGIPVISVSAVWQPRGIDHPALPAGIVEYRQGNLETCFETKPDLSDINTVTKVSQDFIKQLTAITG